MIYLDKNKQEPLYMQIYSQIRQEITEGILTENQVLTGSRGLAKILHVSRNTVDSAYSQLVAEGYITPRKGIGHEIAKIPKIKEVKREKPSLSSNVANQEDIVHSEILYDLTNHSHTSDLFPKSSWKKYTLECLERLEQESKISSYQDKQGELYLRQNLLSYLKRIRGVHCDESQIIITCGIQQSLDYICKLLPSKCTTVLMEEPGFNKAASVFGNNKIKICTVPVDENGLIISKLPNHQDVCALYCTPSHQFPTGVTMPIDRRYRLLEWAKQNDIYIIEDDFDSEQRFYAKPIPSLQSIDSNNCVIYLGTFSKALSPSIRMGYMILPPQLMEIYQNKFENYNSTAPLLNQYVIGRLIETGQYDRHIRKLNNIFRNRLELFSTGFSDVEGKIRLSGNGTGQYVLLKFNENVSQNELIQKALEYKVRVYSTMEFWQDKADCPPNTLFLGISKIDSEDIPDCVKRLKAAWAKWL